MQQPTPEQIEEIRRQIAADAAKHGMTPEQYIEKLKAQAQQQHQAQMRAQQQQQQQGGGGPPPQQQGQGQPQAIQPGPPNPAAIAVANFLKSQELKNRTVIHDEKRKDMFKGETHIQYPPPLHLNVF
jgi:translocation protein SEC62